MKVLIAVPCFDQMYTDFGMSLLHLTLAASKTPDLHVSVADLRGTDIVGARNTAAKVALDMESQYLFFLDSDLSFPSNTLHRLLGHGKPVVGASYIRRSHPFDLLGHVGQGDGLVPATELPTGCLLINTMMLKKVGYPYFKFEYNTDGSREGEDQFFSRRVLEVGGKLWCDKELTKEIGHIGIKKYTVADSNTPAL